MHARFRVRSTARSLLLAALVAVPSLPLHAESNETARNDAAMLPLPTLPPTAPAAISIREIARGQKGYGLSVFEGSEPERFDVEVIGVLDNMRPGTSYILAKLTGHGLEESGVIAGMSGSPVFLDGRLAGAVAFSWPFSNGAIAGITPIGAMRNLTGAVNAAAAPAGAKPSAAFDEALQVLSGKAPADYLPRQLAALRPRVTLDGALGSGAGTSGIGWSATGAGALTQGVLAQALGSVAPAGTTATASDLFPGGSVAAVLVDGDFRLAATGTVTDRDRDQVLAFGHPFLGLGPVEIPMASADVLTVISSKASSFKLANVGPVIGAFREDRLAGIRGRIGDTARTIPVTVNVSGAERQTFRMQVADIPEMAAPLIGLSTLSSLDAASWAAGQQELALAVDFDLGPDHGHVAMRQVFDGPNAAGDTATYLMALGNFLLQNPMAKVDLHGVTVDLVQAPAVQAASLVAAHAERTRVRPGDTVGVSVELAPYRGEPYRHAFHVKLPADLPPGRYSLLVGDGTSIDAARLQVQGAAPETFAQAIAMLRSFHSRRELVTLGVFFDGGLAVAGETLPRLPGSMLSLWGAAGSRSATPVPLAIAQQQVEIMPVPIDGAVRIDLQVERPQPVAGDAATPSPDAGTGDDAAPADPGADTADTAESAGEVAGGAR